MQITSVRAKNFLSFGNDAEEIQFDDLNIIVGPNNSGKTNLFRAITFVADVFSNKMTDFTPYYHNADLEHPFEVSVGIQLNKEEAEAVSDFLICSGIAAAFNPESGEQHDAVDRLKREVLLTHGKDFFEPLLGNMILEVRGQAQENYPSRNWVKIVGSDGRELFMHRYGTITRNSNALSSYIPVKFPALLIDELRRRYAEPVSNYLRGQTNTVPALDYTPTNVFDLVFGQLNVSDRHVIDIDGFNFRESEHRLADVRELRRLRSFVSSMGYAEDAVNIFNVITTIYNSAIIRTSNIRTKPQAFLSPQETLPSIRSPVIELSGEELPSILFGLKNSGKSQDRRRYAKILEIFKKITDGSEFDVGVRSRQVPTQPHSELAFIEPSQLLASRELSPMIGENFRLLAVRTKEGETIRYELIIQVVKGDLAIPLEFAAAGMFESLILLTALVGHEQKAILLDEPALNLHPILQRRILEVIKNSIQSGNQVITITHSPYLIDAEQLENIWRFVSLNGNTKVIHLAATLTDVDKEDVQKFIKELRNSEVRMILFSRGAILVEGPSDKIVIEKLDHHLSSNGKGANIEDNEWNVVAIEGKNSLGTFIKLVSKLGIPYACVMDYDALMRCEKTIRIDGSNIKTASIPYYLHLAGMLESSEIGIVRNLENSIERYNDKLWYSQKALDTLRSLTRSHNMFVLTTDLEGVLQSPATRKDSKPLRALDTISELLSNDKVPTELYEMIDFIKKVISKHP